MCGIAGWLGYLEDGRCIAERMMRLLHHRGPDAQGFQQWPEATLAHTRLSIIDLSPAGAQPMPNKDETIWVVFNGEIYNHRQLRSELEAKGHCFRGHSDTEVLTYLYEEEGVEFIKRLRGMFAIAIYDRRWHTLLLARDRYGIKPLFYAASHNRLAFASELTALKAVPGIDLQPDRQAIYDFANLFYIPAPDTFYKGIKALKPAELLTAQLRGERVEWQTSTYHQWHIAPNPDLTLTQAADQVDEILTAAVQQQLESDVPLGSLLSGGIDSSLVSAAAQRGVPSGIQTFNVQFPNSDYDETWAAQSVAKHIGSQHFTLDINKERGTWDTITGLLQHAGQPFADTSLFAVNSISRLMRKHVTVALSGDGGDEAFGGYNLYWQLARIARLQLLPEPIWHATSAVMRRLRGFMPGVPEHWPERMRDLAGADDASVLQNLFCWIREREVKVLCRDTDVRSIKRHFAQNWEHHLAPGTSRVERLSALATEVNLRLQLPNDFLFKVDTASMRESLEVRVPMLDDDLVAFGLTLPHRLKVSGRTCKLVLRAVAELRLPAAIAAKPKRGFGIPVNLWVDDDFKARLPGYLLGRSNRLPEYFRAEVYRPWVEAFCQGRLLSGMTIQGLYQRIIMLLAMSLALDGVTARDNISE